MFCLDVKLDSVGGDVEVLGLRFLKAELIGQQIRNEALEQLAFSLVCRGGRQDEHLCILDCQ
ncbi:hypothetical protein B4U45_22245 [Mycobacterium persicum]|uniref:Uncharacterized protein n=1 Tax=Mycobacterium persicum TaxID=1487726 RepID=A0A8E2IVW4_9MYCO|nr:hypothetical protein A4G31_21105 [Mycobacterium persicum]ORC13111.1 hypothetical protein B1T46_22490 [Mycobacterium kansasii]PBD12641.1 hypothetical protein BI295_13875 [Mycobacterium avium subsp. hominissuis]ORB96744.1 hypothetical protein B1T44_22110 [Mycobacterium persicum]ORC03455.1 hypothetical protein B1T48_21685 [Mycobacterium persicum]